MIYYKEEKKKLVIPSGFVMIPIDCDEAIEQAREDGYREGFADGSSATCDTEEGTYSLTDDFDGEETVFPSEGKTGFNKIVIVDDGYGDAKYDEGYADGIADCSGSTPCDCSSAVTEAYQSGYTEGYNQGQADCPECSGGTCNLQEKVFVVTDPAMENVFPDAGYDGLSQVMLLTSTLWDSAHTSGYNEGYQSGYTAGLNDCSGTTPNLQRGDVSLGSDWTGFTWTYPDAGYDGFSDVIVADTGYGQAKYDAGYQSGSTDGYTDGFNDGYLSGASDTCGSAVNEAYELGYQSGTTDGFNDGHSSGYTDGFDEGHQVGYTQGYEAGQADCPTCPQGVLYNVELDSGWTGISDILPGELINEITITDNGYGEAKHNEGYAEGYDDGFNEGHSSGYTEGYADGQAACSAATEEAYESGVTEGQGSIFSVKVRWLSPVTSWNLDNYYYPDLFIVDESGTSHQLNYVYQQSPTLVRYNTGMEDDTPQGWIMFAEFAGYLQDGAKYIQPYQVKFPMLNNNLWNNNIEGLSVEINGEVIHNWRQDDSGLDDWQFGSGAWRFTPLATVVSDTYYDATHKMVTFYIQGQVPNNN